MGPERDLDGEARQGELEECQKVKKKKKKSERKRENMTSVSVGEGRDDWRERQKCSWALSALSAVYYSQSQRTRRATHAYIRAAQRPRDDIRHSLLWFYKTSEAAYLL